jgi:hypothetical protein
MTGKNNFSQRRQAMVINHIEVLDLAREGCWDLAHQRVQPHTDRLSCLIHAYLHRVEGDNGNARYWYNRAGSSMPANTLDEELARLYSLVHES